MLDYGIEDFRKPGARRANRRQLLEELQKNVKEADYHLAILGPLTPEKLLSESPEASNFEMKGLLAKEVVYFRKRIIELYVLFPDKEESAFWKLLLDLREAERALILLEQRRIQKKKVGTFDSKGKKDKKFKEDTVAELLARAEASIAEIESHLAEE